MGQAKAIKTIRQPLEHRPTVSLWFTTTQALFNAVVAFYWQVLDAHPGVLDLSSKDALTALEGLTHTTADHPTPMMPLSQVADQVPALVRRAAIHAALGSMRSFQSHRARWQRAKAKSGRQGETLPAPTAGPPADLEPLGGLLRWNVGRGHPGKNHAQALRWADLALGPLPHPGAVAADRREGREPARGASWVTLVATCARTPHAPMQTPEGG